MRTRTLPSPGQLELFSTATSEASLYHQAGDWGFFSLLYSQLEVPSNMVQLGLLSAGAQQEAAKRAGKHQRSYFLNKMPEVLGNLAEFGDPARTDIWISQAEFSAMRRRAIYAMRVALCWVDLDYYSVETLRDKAPEVVAEMVLRRCVQRKLPLPSLILSSGRGLQVKWFHEVLPAKALPRWNAVQEHLTHAFMDLGADRQARDIARVLRVVGTTNTKNGGRIRPVHITDDFGDPVRYVFDHLANAVLPYARDEYLAMKAEEYKRRGEQWAKRKQAQEERKKAKVQLLEGNAAGSGNLTPFNPVRWNWDRVHDYRLLAQLRPPGRRPEGFSDALMWLAGSALAYALWGDVARFDLEVRALGRELCPHWPTERIQNAVATVRDRAQQHATGDWVEYEGRTISPIYTPRNDTVIDRLGITPEEMQQLRTLIDSDTKRERHREAEKQRRRAAGAASRDEYEAHAATRREKAIRLRGKGLSWQSVADAMGLPSADAARKLASR